jgi:hypothetical protein
MHRPNDFTSILQVLVKSLSFFDSLVKVDLGQPVIPLADCPDNSSSTRIYALTSC